jgi:hypothetical protein
MKRDIATGLYSIEGDGEFGIVVVYGPAASGGRALNNSGIIHAHVKWSISKGGTIRPPCTDAMVEHMHASIHVD